MKIYLDLLPTEQKKELHRNKIFHRIIKQELLFALPLFALIGVLFAANFVLKNQKENVVLQNSQVQTGSRYQELDSYENKFKITNENTANLSKIQAGHLQWTEILKFFNSLVPENVHIISIATKNYKMMISGLAQNRDDLLTFKDKLEKNTCITEVNLPLSNIVQRENIDFQMDFSIKEECLKVKK